jgi:hypothetical protein
MAFALAAGGVDAFATDCLGVLSLAKWHGAGPLYRPRRAN